MCDACVMNAVKDRMLSRRSFFKTGAAVAAATTLVAVAPSASMAAGHNRVLDMTHTYDTDFPTYEGVPGFRAEQKFEFSKDGYNLFELTISEHTGTHIDAPLHFSADGKSVDEIAAENLVCSLAVIDIAARAADDADAQVTPDDIKAWIDANGPISDGACVAMHSGWSGKTQGTGFRNADSQGVMHFPGFHVETAMMLLEETNAASIGVDTLSLDFGASADFAAHYAWLPTGCYGIECLAGLDKVPAAGATLIVGAPKHRGGTGGPTRIFALI